MASIFKLKRDGNKRDATWWIEYKNEFGKRKRKKGFTDRRLSEQLAAELEDKVRLKTSGLVDPILEALGNHRAVPIEVHLGDYEIHLGGGSRTSKHKTLTIGRVRRMVEAAGIQNLSDVQPNRVESYIQSLYVAGMGARTLNHYVQAVGGWCRWLVRNNRLAANPLDGLTRYNAEADVRHQRRALTIDEVSLLIESARSSDKRIQGVSPQTRSRIYELAFFTGFRRAELASLNVASFDLKSAQPTVTVIAGCSKHRRKDILPLHPQLVRTLPEWLRGLKATDRLFPGLERKKTWLMVKKDLERVGIPYETPEGIADFHASGRHSYITELFRNGVSITDARELARHKDVKMTMRYTHVGLADQAKALSSLPETTNSKSAGQHIGRTPRRRTSDDTSRRDIASHKTQTECDAGTHSEETTSGTTWQKKTGDGDPCHTSPVSGGGGNRTRLLIPRNALSDNELAKCDSSLGVTGEYPNVSEWLAATLNVIGAAPQLLHLVRAWNSLPPHIRETISTLIVASGVRNDAEPAHLDRVARGVSYYFACSCGAKWFGAEQECHCPRCDSKSVSPNRIQPPWLERKTTKTDCSEANQSRGA